MPHKNRHIWSGFDETITVHPHGKARRNKPAPFEEPINFWLKLSLYLGLILVIGEVVTPLAEIVFPIALLGAAIWVSRTFFGKR